MKQFSKTFAKGGIAAATVGAMALAGATPAQARGDDDGISVGEVIAGAVIIGGIRAPQCSAASAPHRSMRAAPAIVTRRSPISVA